MHLCRGTDCTAPLAPGPPAAGAACALPPGTRCPHTVPVGWGWGCHGWGLRCREHRRMHRRAECVPNGEVPEGCNTGAVPTAAAYVGEIALTPPQAFPKPFSVLFYKMVSPPAPCLSLPSFPVL